MVIPSNFVQLATLNARQAGLGNGDKEPRKKSVAKPTVASAPRRNPRATKGGPNPIDAHVGARVRLRRTLLGLSQEKLGDALGLTFQQVQKYERGVNRVGASRLYSLSKVLDVPITFFYEDMPAALTGMVRRQPGLEDSAAANYDAGPMSNRETMELVKAYYRINDRKKRRKVLDLLRSMGKEQ
jgi:transcriptional regulator with XRE-family HTH domain